VWALMVVGVITEFSLVIWGALFLKEVAGVADGWAPPLSAFFAVGVLAGRFATPYVLLRISGARLTQLGFVTAGIGGLLLWAADPLAIRLAALAIVGIGVAPIYPLVMEQLFATAPDEQARLSAAAAMASGLAISVGPLVLGIFADAVGLRSAILGLAVAATVGLIGSIRITRPRVVSR
jgi:MFS family permease